MWPLICAALYQTNLCAKRILAAAAAGRMEEAARGMQAWGAQCARVAYDPLGMGIISEGAVTDLDPGRPVVVVANHPFTITFFAMAMEFFNKLGYRAFVPIVKEWPPWIEKGPMRDFLAAVKSTGAVLIPRNGKADLKEVIRQHFNKIGRSGYGVVCLVFADQHRPMRHRLHEARVHLIRKHGIHWQEAQLLRYCQVPRIGGLAAMMQGLEEFDPQLVQLTVGMDRWPAGRGNPSAEDLQGTNIRLRWRQPSADSLPDWGDREAVRRWLMERMWEWNSDITLWVNPTGKEVFVDEPVRIWRPMGTPRY